MVLVKTEPAVISFNRHYPGYVDYRWKGNLPLRPQLCFESVLRWLISLHLSKDQVHKVIMPGVREGLVLTAYHSVMGHFPTVLYAFREDGQYIWQEASLQEWREEARSRSF